MMAIHLIFVAVALVTVHQVASSVGVDVASYVNVSTAKCFTQQQDVDFAVVRVWHSFGGFDDNGPPTIANFWQAGYKHVDGYVFPCISMSASSQVNATIVALEQASTEFGMLWFDIEPNPSAGCGWSADTTSNCAYMQELVEAAAQTKVSWGVYTYWDGWFGLMGQNCLAGGSLPLWWASYDGQQNFNDWQPLGPWQEPAIKQYSGSSTVCDMYLDMDWYPDSQPTSN